MSTAGVIVASLSARVKAASPFAALVIAGLLPLTAAAEPVTLKLAFFPPEHTAIYDGAIRPFVSAVNAEGKGLLTIKVFPGGALGKSVAEQPQMVLDGVADIGWVIPGQTPYRFPDNQLLEMPGLFENAREGTLTYTHLIAEKALRGYEDFVVIGAFTADPTIISSRKPVGSLTELKGQKIRANNPIEAEVLARLGAIPTVLPAPRLAEAIKRGAIDGAALAPAATFDFRVAPVAKHQYLLRGGVAPLVLLMNRKKFESLPEGAQALIRKYSGEWTAAAWITAFGLSEERSLANLKSESGHSVVEPSPADRATAHQIYQSMIDSWAARSAQNRALLKMIEANLAKVRSVSR